MVGNAQAGLAQHQGVIGAIPNQVVTEDLHLVPTTDNGHVVADPDRDLLKLAVVERHHRTGNVGLGLVKGVGLKRGAIASSIAHDSHNIIVIGADDDEMRAAVTAIADMGGGQVVVAGGEVRRQHVVVVRQERTAREALVPVGAEHEVVHHQLAVVAEQLVERTGAVFGVEDVVRLDADPRQRPATAGEVRSLSSRSATVVAR